MRWMRNWLCVGLVCWGCVTAWAQQIEPDDLKFEFKKVEVTLLKYQDTYPNALGLGTGGRDDWLRIQVEYEINLKNGNKYPQQGGSHWVDQCEFNWRVVLGYGERSANPVKKPSSLRLEKKETYANIKIDGRKHRAVVYVHSRTLERFAPKIPLEQVGLEVRVKVSGKTVGEEWSLGGKSATQAEARNANSLLSLLGDENVRLLPGALLGRRETPWVWSSEDFYEQLVETPR